MFYFFYFFLTTNLFLVYNTMKVKTGHYFASKVMRQILNRHSSLLDRVGFLGFSYLLFQIHFRAYWQCEAVLSRS